MTIDWKTVWVSIVGAQSSVICSKVKELLAKQCNINYTYFLSDINLPSSLYVYKDIDAFQKLDKNRVLDKCFGETAILMVLDEALAFFKTQCFCDIDVIMQSGCQCGGD